MFDLVLFCYQFVDFVECLCISRGFEFDVFVLEFLEVDCKCIQVWIQELQSLCNSCFKVIGQVKVKGEDVLVIMVEVVVFVDELKVLEVVLDELCEKIEVILMGILNLLVDDVLVGVDENDNVEQVCWGILCQFDFKVFDYVELGVCNGWLDGEIVVKLFGLCFIVLCGLIVCLYCVLVQFMVDLYISEYGYEEINVLLLVNVDLLCGISQLLKFEDDLFKIVVGDFMCYLILILEVLLINIVCDEIVDVECLLLCMIVYLMCFCVEVGSGGCDVCGMICQYQFEKVELVLISCLEDSEVEYQCMICCVEVVLEKLGLLYCKVLLCIGDMGFLVVKIYDLEVWLLLQEIYCEIFLCLNCGDFQVCCMQVCWCNLVIGKLELVYILNGLGVVVGCVMIVVMENYQNVDGSIIVLEVLCLYMGGLESIG